MTTALISKEAPPIGLGPAALHPGPMAKGATTDDFKCIGVVLSNMKLGRGGTQYSETVIFL
jgi:hypothetical protein